MRLFLSASDKERLSLRYTVYREDELVLTSAMLDDAMATADRYTNNVEHAAAVLSVHDLFKADQASPVIYSKRGQSILLPLRGR